MARSARPLPCPWCGSRTLTQPELGGVGWRVVCTGAYFGAAPCRAAGPIRLDVLHAADAWNSVVRKALPPSLQPTPLPDDAPRGGA